jgi:hypothetical protein
MCRDGGKAEAVREAAGSRYESALEGWWVGEKEGESRTHPCVCLSTR